MLLVAINKATICTACSSHHVWLLVTHLVIIVAWQSIIDIGWRWLEFWFPSIHTIKSRPHTVYLLLNIIRLALSSRIHIWVKVQNIHIYVLSTLLLVFSNLVLLNLPSSFTVLAVSQSCSQRRIQHWSSLGIMRLLSKPSCVRVLERGRAWVIIQHILGCIIFSALASKLLHLIIVEGELYVLLVTHRVKFLLWMIVSVWLSNHSTAHCLSHISLWDRRELLR